MPKKPQPSFDWLKLVPLAVIAVTFVSGYTSLGLRLANAEDKVKSQQEWLLKQSADSSSIKIAQGRMEEKVDATYAMIQEMRSDIKESNRRGR